MIVEKRNVLNTGIMNIVAMIVLYLFAFFLLQQVTIGSGTILGTVLTLVIGLIPAFLWLSFFYFLDRVNPEPPSMVFAAFLAGIISNAVFNGFFGSVLFDISSWTLNANALPVVPGLFQNAVFPAVAIYLVIRYLFYVSKEFNEHVDGLMYGAFTGIGYAFLEALQAVFQAGSVSAYYLLFTLIVRLALFSSLGALIGYCFGLARFNEDRKELYFLLSLVIAIAVFAMYDLLITQFQLSVTLSRDISAISMAVTVAFTVVLLGLVFFLIQKTIKTDEARDMGTGKFFIDMVSVAAIVLFLGGGIFCRILIEGDKQYVSSDRKISFQMPAAYSMSSEKTSTLAYADAQNNQTDYYMNLLTFTKKQKNQSNPVLLRIGFCEEPPLPVTASPGKNGPVIKIGDYLVETREYEQTASLETAKDLAFDATVYEYTAKKEGQKIIINVQSPVPEPDGFRDMAARMLQSLQFAK
jgi:protease PrsW